jgi:orotidine-5'-phosphate decarboxylase
MPGIGKQGGNLERSLRYGANDDYGLLINSSRGIIYASSDFADFDEKASIEATKLNSSIQEFIDF